MSEQTENPALEAALVWARHYEKNATRDKVRERFRVLLAAFDAQQKELGRLRPMEPELEVANKTIRAHILKGAEVYRLMDRAQFQVQLTVDEPLMFAARISVAREIGLKVAQEIAGKLIRGPR